MDWRNLPSGDRRPPHLTTWLTLALAGAALCAFCWAFAHTDRTLPMRPGMLALFLCAFAVFLVAVSAVWRARAELHPRLAWLVVIVGIALRLAVAPIRPATTSDVYRYLWEGRVVRAGLNPYRDPPSSPRLAHLRNWVWHVVPFKSVPAAYPPAAQYIFAAAGLIPGPPVILLKLVLALFDVGTVLVLVSVLAAMNLPRAWVILYAWHPLAVCELVARGHLDTAGIFLMALTFRLLLVPTRAGSAFAGAALTLSILAKGYALVIAPFLVLAARPRRWVFLLAMVATAVFAYAPFASAGPDLFRGAAMYGRGWRGNSSVFPLVDLALSPLTTRHDIVARGICLVALLAWLAILVTRAAAVCGAGVPAPSAPEGSPSACPPLVCGTIVGTFPLLALIGLFLLSPAVYPWYLGWTLPLLCMAIATSIPREGRPPSHAIAWLLLTGAIFGFYAHDLAGHHREIWWVTTGEYALPALAALACWRGDWLRISPRRTSHAPPDT